jgi:Tfp pilus assembly protein PilF
MAVTLPLVLLLLDLWPLGRLRWAAAPRPVAVLSAVRSAWRPLAEKLPLFLLAGIAALVTFQVQSQGGALRSPVDYPLGVRAANALLSVLAYLRDTVWPRHLAALYPHPRVLPPLWQLAGAAAVLVAISLAAVRGARRAPWLGVGWLWFLGMLVPVSGLVQAGLQGRADRYTYLPLVGIFLAVAWLAPRRAGVAWGAAACGAVLALAVVARTQVETWRDSVTLFRHAVAVTSNNWQAHANLGRALAAAGRNEEAVASYREALRLFPYLGEERLALGGLLLGLGRPAEAIGELQAGVRTRPDLWWGHLNLADALLALGRHEEAAREYRRTIELRPRCAPAHNNLGTILFNRGRIEEASREFAEAAGADPRFAEAHYNLGVTLSRLGRREEAVARWEETLRLDPRHAGARRSLAELRAR